MEDSRRNRNSRPIERNDTMGRRNSRHRHQVPPIPCARELPYPRGRTSSPENPRTPVWQPTARIEESRRHGNAPDETNTLVGQGRVKYLGQTFGIIKTKNGDFVCFEIAQAVSPAECQIRVGNCVRFESIYFPNTQFSLLYSPKYEAKVVRVLDPSPNFAYYAYSPPSDTKSVQEIPQEFYGNGKIWYSGRHCGILRDSLTGQGIFYYNTIATGLDSRYTARYAGGNKLRYWARHGVCTEYDAVWIDQPVTYTRLRGHGVLRPTLSFAENENRIHRRLNFRAPMFM